MNIPKDPRGQVLAPAAAIGTLALLLAGGLGLLGFLERLDGWIGGWLAAAGGIGEASAQLPSWVSWFASAVAAYGLSALMLMVPGAWRRATLWAATAVLVLTWAPVLVLVGREPAISAAFIAVVWSGACAWVYAKSHRMECDETPALSAHGAR